MIFLADQYLAMEKSGPSNSLPESSMAGRESGNHSDSSPKRIQRVRKENPCTEWPHPKMRRGMVVQQLADILRKWLLPQGHTEAEIVKLLDCLDENKLRDMAKYSDFPWPLGGIYGNISGAHWRYRSRRELARKLGWIERKSFPEEFNVALKEKLWPDAKIEPRDGYASICL